MSRPAILMLAAGSSQRMGAVDKLLLDIAGVPLLRHSVRNACTAGDVYVVLAKGHKAHRAALAGLDVTIIEPAQDTEGMGASIRAGIAGIGGDRDLIVIALADMPGVTPDTYARVIAAHAPQQGRLICRATTQDGRTGHPVAFDRRFFPDLARVRGDQGGRAIVRANPQAVFDVPTSGTGAIVDLDTPEDWENWKRIHG